MEKKERRIYQIMDADCNYRSCIVYNGEELDYISKERTKAIVYTYDEAKKVAVMIECRTVYSKKDI